MQGASVIALHLAAVSAGLLLAGAAAVTLWQVHRLRCARRWARRSGCAPFETVDRDGDLRILVLGDSTAVGVGAANACDSIPGLVVREPFAPVRQVAIVNRSRNGARVADFVRQAAPLTSAAPRFDLVVIIGGGNDVLRFTRHADLRRDAHHLLTLTSALAQRVVWLGCPDIGLAPLFLPPFAWLLGRRTRATMHLFAAEAARAGVAFLDFSRGAQHARIVAQRAQFFAPDGMHPSAAAYRHGFDALCELLRAGVAACNGPAVTSALTTQVIESAAE